MTTPPQFLESPGYTVLSRLGAPGWAAVLQDLAQVNRERMPRGWPQRASDPTRFRIAATLEAIAQNDESILLSLLPGPESAEYLRIARGAYSWRDNRTYGPVRHLTPATFITRGAIPAIAPDSEQLRQAVAAGGRLIAINIQIPVVHLHQLASELGWKRGRGTEPITRLDPLWYDDLAPYEFNDEPGPTHLNEIQGFPREEWALLLIPVGTPIKALRSYMEALHRTSGTTKTDSALNKPKGAPGRPRQNQAPRLIIPISRVTQEALAMDLSQRTFTAWSENRIVPLFDLLVWKRAERRTVKDDELASWLWPEAHEDPKGRLDHVRRQLATALAVSARLRSYALSTLPYLQRQNATAKLAPFFSESC